MNSNYFTCKKTDNSALIPQIHHNLLISFMLLFFFTTTYSLIYSGTFTTDDEHILTARSLSLAFDDQLNLSRVIGNSRVSAYSLYGPTGAMEAANIEPTQAILGAVFAKLSIILGVGRIQTLFLLNIWTTALTAMMLYLTARRQFFSDRISMIVALLFGLCTIVFPYSKTYFRDSLAMFFLSCLWFFATAIRFGRDDQPTAKTVLLWLGFVLSGVLGVLSKNTILIAIPVLLFEIAFFKKANISSWISIFKKRSAIKWIILIFFILVLLFWFLGVPKIPFLARFSPAYYGSLVTFFFTTPHPYLLQALTGPLISPGKSIFIFSPILILSLITLFSRFKTSWSAWTYLILLIIAQSLFYDDEWAGHVNWGLRFVIPAIPPLILSIAPLIDSLLVSKFRKILFIGLALISSIVQVLGVLSPVRQYFNDKAVANPPIIESALTWDIHQSPIWWSFQKILNGGSLDLALTRIPSVKAIIIVGISIVLLIVCFCCLFKKARLLPIIGFISVVCLNIAMLIIYKNDPAWMKNRDDLSKSQQMISSQYHKGDLILLKSYGTPSWEYWMNWTEPDLTWTSLPFFFPSPSIVEAYQLSQDPELALDGNSSAILNQEVFSGRQVWLILPADSTGSYLGIEEKWLSDRSKESNCSSYPGAQMDTKVCLFSIK